MSKRTADASEDGPLKAGGRPDQMDMDIDSHPAEMGEFEDEFEDEFEEEILEAGVDGRPDAELEAEQKGISSFSHIDQLILTDDHRRNGSRSTTGHIYRRPQPTRTRPNPRP